MNLLREVGTALHDALSRQAPCTDANPDLFDVTTYEQAWPALSYCYSCPVTALCDQVVRPAASYYDGVAAARVWRNGLRLTLDGKVIGRRSRRNREPLPALALPLPERTQA